jgi:oligopeptide transport system ATP-binding protein
MAAQNNNVIVQVDRLVKYYQISGGTLLQRKTSTIHAVDDISLTFHKGETLGLIGDSGCGKTTLAKTILQLEKPTSGSVVIDHYDATELSGDSLRALQDQTRMIHQIPETGLNLKKTVETILNESLPDSKRKDSKQVQAEVESLLNVLGLHLDFKTAPLGELSDGQRQSLAIAQAIAASPVFIACDEPVSHLDASTQAKVLDLMEEKRNQTGLSSLFICNDLAVIRRISDRVAVMYLGVIVELAEREEFCARPLHPFTQILVSAAPVPSPAVEARRHRLQLEGDFPSNLKPPPGCRFRLCCPLAEGICAEQTPELKDAGAGHFVACHLV